MNSVPMLSIGSKSPVTAIGTFKIHGVEREIEVKGTVNKNEKGELELEAEFDLLLSDFSIPIPKLVFYELAENQKVTIKATLTPKMK